jgi:hypothetical protein
MQLYAILRRGIATPDDVEAVATRSAEELDKRADQVRKIRSYILAEPDGRLGTICIYEATDPDAIYEHGRAASLAVDEVIKVNAIDVVRPDPVSVVLPE